MKRHHKEELVGGMAQENAKIIMDIFDGVETGAKRDAVILNAGAAIYVSGKAETLEDGIQKAREAIDNGKAKEKLEELIKFSKDVDGEVV
jgi:anthranilate phosphoribosyltransferase